ncbi:MAG: hypothetical protein WDN69_06490 [Aliidongia sp.]
MLPVKIGLVDTTGTVPMPAMAMVAAALNVQVTRDLQQFWPVIATVCYLPDPNVIPQGVWPVLLVSTLPQEGGGFHLTVHNQPYAQVLVTPGSDEWTVDASHETIEMLVDPFGNRLQTSTSIQIVGNDLQDGNEQYEYLVEACDPCEADSCTYQIGGIRVSDFITPYFYDLLTIPGLRYSFTGAITRPREILPGGYISWMNPQTNAMQQILRLDPNAPPQCRDLGMATGASLRAFVEKQTAKHVRAKRIGPTAEAQQARTAFRDAVTRAGQARAKHYI